MSRILGSPVCVRSSIACALILALLMSAALASPALSNAKKPSNKKPRPTKRINGVAVDSTGIPKYLADALGTKRNSGEVEDFKFPQTLGSVTKLEFEDGWIGFKLLRSPRNVKRESYQHGVVYRTRPWDLIQHVTSDSRMRESIVVRKRQGTRTWRWQLYKSGAGIKPRLDSDGRVLLGRGGYIDRPALHHFNGRVRNKLRWSLRGNILELRVSDRGVKLPYIIDPPLGADVTPPVVTFDGFQQNTPLTTHVNSVGNTLYYRPDATGNFDMQFRATDDQSGVDFTRFPNLGLGWSPGGDDPAGWSGASALPNSGTGLNGSYQNYAPGSTCAGTGSPPSAAFNGVGFTRIEGPIDFNWGGAAPPGATGIQPDCFTVRWMGYFEAPSSGSYWFRTRSDDGVRLWVDGFLANDFWTEHAVQMACGGQVHGRDNNTTRVASPAGIPLTAGQRVPIVLDFNENGGQAVIGLQYRMNPYTNNNNGATGCNAVWGSGGWTVVPQGRLYVAEQYEWNYAWTANPNTPPAGLGVTAHDNAIPANVSTPKQFAVVPDSTGPTGGSITAPTGYSTSTTNSFSFNAGSDALTQTIDYTRVEQQSQPLINGACSGPISPWTLLVANPSSPFSATQLPGYCYTFRLISADGVSNESIFNGSATPLRIDSQSPTGITPVTDGIAPNPDISYVGTTTIAAYWNAVSEPWSGLDRYQYCISTGVNASGCSTGILQSWMNVPGGAASSSISQSFGSLTNGSNYRVCVRARDLAGNPEVVFCSNGQTYDSTPPSAPGMINDSTGVDVDWQASNSVMNAGWLVATDAQSGVVGYQTCVSTSSTGSDCAGSALAPWNATSPGVTGTRAGLTLAMGTTYYFCVRAENGAGLLGAVTCSDGVQIDGVGPVPPATINDHIPAPLADVDWTASSTSLHANWSAATDISPILRYERCFTAQSNGSDCTTSALRPFVSTGLTQNSSATGLSLSDNTTWYVCVRAVDTLLNMGTHACSDGVTVDTSTPSAPSFAADGPSADIQWTASAASSTANWGTSLDSGSGVSNYRWCVKAMTGGADCSTGTIYSGPSTTALTTVTASIGIPPAGTMHRFCIAAVDLVGNTSAYTCTDGQRADVATPSTITSIADGSATDIDYQSSTTTIEANWPASTDTDSGLVGYQFCITLSASGSDCNAAALVSWQTNGLATTLSHALTLTNGTQYFVCVRALDAVGNISANTCSDGVTVDAGPPIWPGGSFWNDGLGPGDQQWTTSMTTLSSHWSPATDPIGVQRYEYCLSTATGCSGTIIKGWTSNGAAQAQTSTGLALNDATLYYSCVRAYDFANNVSTTQCSNGQTVDATVPSLPTTVNDGPAFDLTWLQSTLTASANWFGGSDSGSGIANWYACLSALPSGADCASSAVTPWGATGTTPNKTFSPLVLIEGSIYYTCVYGVDTAGNQSAGSTCSDGQRVDTQAPPAPSTVNDGTGADISYQSLDTQISANWTSVVDPVPGTGSESGLARYEYCVTSVASGANCGAGAMVTWTAPSPVSATGMTHTGLSLTNGSTYYTCVRAVDNASNFSTLPAMHCSNGTVIDVGPPTASWNSWTVNNIDPSEPYLYSPGGNILWFNPSVPAGKQGTATATVTATDAGAGMDRVEFPSFGVGGWSAGGTDNSPGFGSTWSWTYSMSSGTIGDPPPDHATAYDTGGASTGSPALDYDVRPDSTPPVVTAMPALPMGLQNTTTYTMTVPLGTDAGSGIARWEYLYSYAPLVDNACGAWSAPQPTTPRSVGSGSNGSAVTTTFHLNDLIPFDGIADYHDSFCWRESMTVWDHVGNSAVKTPVGYQRFDFGEPDVAVSAPADLAPINATTTFNGTADDEYTATDPLEYLDTGSGIDRIEVHYQHQLLPAVSGAACPPASPVGVWPSQSWSCAWDTTLSGQDGWYDVTFTAYDRAGNSRSITRQHLVDNFPPFATFHSFSESSPYLHSAGNVAWFNPNAPVGSYPLDVRVTSYDLGSYVDRVEFPGFGTGWTPSVGPINGAGPLSTPAPNTYTQTYTLTNPSTANVPGAVAATSFDGPGNPAAIPFEVRSDSTAPTGGSAAVTLPSTPQSSPMVSVSLTPGSESALESGLATWQVTYERAPLSGNICAASPITTGPVANGLGTSPSTTTHDVTALGSGCYRYLLTEQDQVGNTASSTASAWKKVDLDDPQLTITAPTNGSTVGALTSITGTVLEPETALDHVLVTWTGPGPGPTSGTACNPASQSGSAPSWTFSCSWNTNTPLNLPDGAYTITVQSFDTAGNSSSLSTVNVTLDKNPPVTTFHSFDTSASSYSYWAGSSTDPLWYNPDAPAGIYSFIARVDASDGGGITRVEFDGAGSGWTPGAGVATQFTPSGPATRWSQQYTFDTSGPIADPPTLSATAFDPANNPGSTSFEFVPDLNDPAAGSVSSTNGYVSSTSVTVTLASGTDGAGSGIRQWELLRDSGTLSGGTCTAWTGYTTSVASGLGEITGSRTDTVADPSCARYRLIVTDNVGRVGSFDATEVTRVDLTPPTGSVTISEGVIGAQYQYLASPTKLFVNTNQSGSFDVNANASAASGVLDVTFPAIASGFTGGGTVSGPGPSFPRSYTWNAASTPAGALSVDARSNSLGTLSMPIEVIEDNAGPTGPAPTLDITGFTVATSVNVTWTSTTDGTGSGVSSHQLQRQVGVLASGTCAWGAWSDVVGEATPGVSSDASLVTATCYRYRTHAVDNVSNSGYSLPSMAVMVDQTAPIGASVTISEGALPARQHVALPDSIWVAENPMGTGTFTVTVTANDPESGTGAAMFPALGSTFIDTAVGPFIRSYSWTSVASTPAVTPTVLVGNGSGLTTTIPFTVQVDATGPAGATIDQENGFVTDSAVDLTYAWGSDGQSGLASSIIQRRSAPYAVGTDTCGAWSTWSAYPFPSGNPGASPHTDTSVIQPTCYQYQVLETDNVGNQSTTNDGDTAKVINDIFPPAAFNLNLPTNPALPAITTAASAPSCAANPAFNSATPNFTWSASSDAESGLAGYDIYLDGIGTPDANVAAPGTSWSSTTLSSGAHTIGVRALDNQANFTNAGPSFPSPIIVDLAFPSVSLNSPANGTWTSDTTPTLDWNASDDGCLARVVVRIDGAQVAVASGSEGSFTVSSALADGMHSWEFDAIDSIGNVTSSGTFTFGVDTVAPTAAVITAPTASQTVRGFVNVAWNAATDAHSGLDAASAYQVIVDGAVRATVGSGTTNVTISGITNGVHSVAVQAFDSVGLTSTSAAVSFTGYGVIPAPTLVNPANNAALNFVPTLGWIWPSDGGPTPTSYDVILNGSTVANELHPTSTHALADPGDGAYTWSINQHDPYTGTVSSSTRSFVLDRTNPTFASAPTQAVTTVSWPAPTDPAAPVASGIDRQEFWIDDGVNPPIVINKTATQTSQNYASYLPGDGIYTMWIRAFDKAGNTTDSSSLTITTDTVAPTSFNLINPPALPALPAITHGVTTSPVCAADLTYVGLLSTLQWTASSDVTSGLAGYDVLLDGGPLATVGAAATSHTLVAPAGGVHTWGVVARDNVGLTRASSPAIQTVRFDSLAPAINYASPANASFTSDTTPSFTWAATDDNCVGRVELTVGSDVYMLTGTANGFTPSKVLPEGPTSWSLRVFDSAGNVVSAGPARTINIDTTAPTSVSATFPAQGSTVPEGMLTFDWSDGSDGAGSGVTRYDLLVDGVTVASSISTSTDGTHPVLGPPNMGDPALAHTWSVRAYDAVGNSAVFPFNFSASYVADTTPPSPFNLLTPSDTATIPAGTPLTWDAAWDFKGVTQYRVFIDGVLAATTAGNVTSFTPAAGTGSPICTVSFPAPSAGCLTAGSQSWGVGTGTSGVGTNWNVASYSGWGNADALGVGDPTVLPITSAAAGFDGKARWTATEYTTTIPATGADLRFEHRYRFHAMGQNSFDGGTVEIMVDKNAPGFADDTWETTCRTDVDMDQYPTLDCDYRIVESAGGYNAVMGGANKTVHPLSGQNSFSGSSPGTVQTRIALSDFAGMNVRVRFRIGTDGCYVGMTQAEADFCALYGVTSVTPAVWYIDDITLANTALAPGSHTWYVQARDAAGNTRNSTQTWSFILP